MINRGANQVLVRCEPHPTHCHIASAPYLILIAPSIYELAYLSATIHTKVMGRKGGAADHSTYLFCNHKLVTTFKEKIGLFAAKNKE